MGAVNWTAVVLGTVVFYIVGAIWYGLLFGKTWQREVGMTEPPPRGAMARIVGLTLLAEFMVAATLGHLFARTIPPDHVKMMMALGFAATIMTPAIGINYLYQRKSLALFLIDAGHFIAGMAALGAVFVALG